MENWGPNSMNQLRTSVRVSFVGGNGFQLAGIIDLPTSEPRAWAIFTHCFTCTKDIKHIVRISRGLAQQGFGVLRYDLTGLGGSQGEFSRTNFGTNQADLLAACSFLAERYAPPDFLIGHSFGGAVSLTVAQQIPSIAGVVSIAAPSDTHHLAGVLDKLDPNISQLGQGRVNIGGYTHQIERQMLENLRSVKLDHWLSELSKPVLLIHSPEDETLDYSHVLRLYRLLVERAENLEPAATTLATLAGADHLFNKDPADIVFVTKLIAAWFERYLPAAT
jgi:uncharacterized protein